MPNPFLQLTPQKKISSDNPFAKLLEAPQEPKSSVRGGFVGEVLTGNTQRFGKTTGEALASGKNTERYIQALEQHSEIRDTLLKTLKTKRQSGKDTTILENALKNMETDLPKLKDFTGDVIDKSTGEIAGEALGTAVEATGIGALKGVKGIGLTKGVAETASKAQKAKTAYNTLSTGGKALDIAKKTAKGVASTAPFGYAYDVSAGLQGQRGEDRTGTNAFKPGLGTALGGAIPGGVGALRATGLGIKTGGRELAPRMINSLIKPLAKDFSYGKNPGRAVAEHGITANSMEELAQNITLVRQKVGQSIGDLSKSLESRTKLDLTDTLKSIDDELVKARQAPRTNNTLIQRLQDVKKDVLGIVDENGVEVPTRNLKNLNYGQSFEIKKLIGDLTKWTGNASDDKAVNKSLKQVYGAIKEKMNLAAKKADSKTAKILEKLNENYADLTSAEIATKYRDVIMQRHNLISLTGNIFGATGVISAIVSGGSTIPVVLAGVGGAALDKVFGSVAVKTRVAAWLSGASKPVVSKLIDSNPKIRPFLYKLITEENLKVDNAVKDYLKNPKIGLGVEDISKKNLKGVYKGEKDLTTKILKDLEGKTTVSKQYILDATNRGELKQVERDLIRQVLDDMGRKSDPLFDYKNTKGVFADEFKGKTEVMEAINDIGGEKNVRAGILSLDDLKPTEIFDENNLGVQRALKEIKSGINTPLIIDEGMNIMDGNHRYVAQKMLGKMNVKVVAPKEIFPSSDTINVSDFAKKVKAELLPLKVKSTSGGYEGTTLPPELRGEIKNYYEHTWESPIETSAGQKHSGLGGSKKYFSHTRVEDLPDNQTRRIIEAQSDLYQKGGLERDIAPIILEGKSPKEVAKMSFPDTKSKAYKYNLEEYTKQAEKAKKLQQYSNQDRSWFFRTAREEIKKAAQDGKTKLQFPTGETAMKIEGLGENSDNWLSVSGTGINTRLRPSNLKLGDTVARTGELDQWIITDILEDGKFKAVPKDRAFESKTSEDYGFFKDNDFIPNVNVKSITVDGKKWYYNSNSVQSEQFDISGKVDTNNPIYKFYNKDVRNYLKNKYSGKEVVDSKGVSWIQVDLTKDMGKLPIEAFSFAPIALTQNEKGN